LDNKKIKYTANIDNTTFEVLNSEFTKAKCYIMYHDQNRNGSAMSKEVVEKAIPSLYNIPIVAEFIEKKEDFGTHGGKIIISDEGITFECTTKPLGLVPESCNARWEMVEDKEYLVADVLLWSGRYSELETTINQFSNQSMEINVFEGEQSEDDSIYNINSFEFSALCLLGRDVEPCFEGSKVVAYSLDEIKTEMDEMFKSYKNFSVVEESVVPIVEPIAETVVFSATYRQKREALQNALDPIRVMDENDNLIECTNYYVSDFDDEYVFVERYHWSMDDDNCDCGRFSYTIDLSNLTATLTSEFEMMIMTWLTMEENQKIQDDRMKMTADFEALQLEKHNLLTEIEDYKLSIESNNVTITELQSFKSKIELENKVSELDELLAEFELTLKDSEEFKLLKVKYLDYEYEDLRKELFAIEGMLNHTKFTKTVKKQTFTSKVSIEPEIEVTTPSAYGSAEKFIPKKTL